MKLISVVRMAQMSINMMMMSNPFTFAMGAASLILTGMSLTDAITGY
jgi:hypothetical protein